MLGGRPWTTSEDSSGNMEPTWSKEETLSLRQLRLDPVQDSYEKLMSLVRHFKAPRPSVFAVTQGRADVHVSKELARKVRDLTKEGKLDWVLNRAETNRGLTGSASNADRDPRIGGQYYWILREHRDQLMPILLDLRGIGQLALHDQDLAIWFSRPADPCWPIAKGRACRDINNQVTVELRAEGQLVWQCLQQHLVDDPVWTTIDRWKEATAEDLRSRLSLLRILIDLIKMPESERGMGLPVVERMNYEGSAEAAASLYAVMDLHGQVMSRALNLRHAMHPREAFIVERPGVIFLAGQPAVSSQDPQQLDRAVDFLIRTREEGALMPEAQVAAAAYRMAEQAAEEVKGHLERLELMLVFPEGSACEMCPGRAS